MTRASTPRGGCTADRRSFVAAMATGMLMFGRPAAAQAPARTWRIGFLTPSTISPRGIMPEMRQRLRELGYVEGRNLTIERRWSSGYEDRLPRLLADLLRPGLEIPAVDFDLTIRSCE